MKKPQVKQSLNMSKDVVTDPSLIVINGPKYFKVMVSNANVKKNPIHQIPGVHLSSPGGSMYIQ